MDCHFPTHKDIVPIFWYLLFKFRILFSFWHICCTCKTIGFLCFSSDFLLLFNFYSFEFDVFFFVSNMSLCWLMVLNGFLIIRQINTTVLAPLFTWHSIIKYDKLKKIKRWVNDSKNKTISFMKCETMFEEWVNWFLSCSQPWKILWY